MDPNPYESPDTNIPAAPAREKIKRKRYVAVYVIVAILGFCAAFILTTPMGAIDGVNTVPHWFVGAALAALTYRIMWS